MDCQTAAMLATGAGATILATPFILPLAGFTAAGVAAGSAAAAVQGAIYGGTVGAGSIFAVLQSAGAGGLAGSTFGTGLVGLVGGIASILAGQNCTSN